MGFNLVHPNRPETWVNTRAPLIHPNLVEQLNQIGGLNDRGEANLRFAWGQTRSQFRRGKERLLYIDERIDAIRHTRHVLKRALLTDENERVTHWDTQILECAPRVVPEGSLYNEELVSIEWIGEQWFYIEQFFEPAIALPNGDTFLPFGTPAQWEKDRYEDWEDPELGMVRHCDVLGPFPREGRFVSIWRCVQPFSYFEEEEEPVHEPILKGNRIVGYKATGQTFKKKTLVESVCYREPSQYDVEAMRAGRWTREHASIRSVEQRGRDKFYEDDLKRREVKEKRLNHARDFMKGEQWRWSSPDSGATGGVGGGARSYATPEKKKEIA